MKKYEEPKLEIVEFEDENILTNSGEDPNPIVGPEL